MCMLYAYVCVGLISVVIIFCPYSWVMDEFRMYVCVWHQVETMLLSLRRDRRLGCIPSSYCLIWCVYVRVWLFVRYIWCVGHGLGMLCVFSLGV